MSEQAPLSDMLKSYIATCARLTAENKRLRELLERACCCARDAAEHCVQCGEIYDALAAAQPQETPGLSCKVVIDPTIPHGTIVAVSPGGKRTTFVNVERPQAKTCGTCDGDRIVVVGDGEQADTVPCPDCTPASDAALICPAPFYPAGPDAPSRASEHEALLREAANMEHLLPKSRKELAERIRAALAKKEGR